MLLAHLSDLHLRDAGDVIWLERQLDRIAARNPDHLVITGDLLDRWNPALLRTAIGALHARGLLTRDRATLLHGNHDLASSGGHPRGRQDLWRLLARFWDPPPLVWARRRRFYGVIEAAAPGVAASAPVVKHLSDQMRVAVTVRPRAPLAARHARGHLRRAERPERRRVGGTHDRVVRDWRARSTDVYGIGRFRGRVTKRRVVGGAVPI